MTRPRIGSPSAVAWVAPGGGTVGRVGSVARADSGLPLPASFADAQNIHVIEARCEGILARSTTQ
jgi:hypothetical protein